MKIFTTILVGLTFVACGDDNKTSSSSKTFNGAAVVLVDSTDLTLADDSASGTGSLVFNDPLEGIEGGGDFKLTFTLKDDGQLTLNSFADKELKNGFDIAFIRESDTLTVTLGAEGKSEDVSTHFADVDAGEAITLNIDVHNDETPAHILIWNQSDAGKKGAELEDAALLNTEHEHEEEGAHEEEGEEEITSPGNGKGSYWGLTLSDATVTVGSVSEPLFEEE